MKNQITFTESWGGSVWSQANIKYYNDNDELVIDTLLASKYEINEGVTEIGDNCFQNCTALKSITISNDITSIGVNCFDGCTNLTTIFITPPTSLESMKTIMTVNNPDVVDLMKGVVETLPSYFLENEDGKFVPIAHSDATFVNELKVDGKSKTLTEKLAEIVASSGVTVEMLTNAVSNHDTSNTAHASIRAILDTCIGQPTWDDTTYTMTFTTKAGAEFSINIPIEQIALSYNAETNEIEFIDAQGELTGIPVIDFIEIYTGSIGDQIQISISSGNVIQATILSNSILKSQLSNEVQSSLNEIDNKIDASALADWVKQPNKPSYTPTEVGAYSVAEVDAIVDEIDTRLTTTETKLNDIDDGAQVNSIESISVNDTPITPDGDKNVNISVPSIDGLATVEEVNTGLATKANSIDVYTKIEVDNKLLETIKVNEKIGEVLIVL